MLVGESNAKALGANALDDLPRPQRLGRTFSVCFDESTNPEFGAPEVAHHREQHIGQIVGPNDAEDGRPGTVAGFAIVT